MSIVKPSKDSSRGSSTELAPHGAAEVASFVDLLRDAGADGLDQYAPEALDVLARSAFEVARIKSRGHHKINWENLTLPSPSGPRAVTAFEILNDDMPFLVDSVIGELQSRGLSANLVVHPIFKVRRSPTGELQALLGPGDRNWGDGTQESYIVLVLDPIADPVAQDLANTLSHVLDDVRTAVTDWRPMLARLDEAINTLESSPPPIPPDLLSETLAFCRWLRDGQFTFLGMREYRLDGDALTGELVPIEGTGLGVLHDPTLHVLRRNDGGLTLTPEIRSQLSAPAPLLVNKSSVVSKVHRRALMDYVGLKIYDKKGALAGELRIVGLFTSNAYTQAPDQIPFLRHKIESTIAQSGLAPGSHAAKAFANVLATFPRDELFQIGEQRLQEWVRGIVELELRPRVRLFARPDRFDRFVSVLVYAQRDRFNTQVRERVGALLSTAYNGYLQSVMPFFPEGPLVRVHYIIARSGGPRPEVDERVLEEQISEATRTWDDQLSDVLRKGGPATAALIPKYRRAFTAGYEEAFTPQRALEDIERIERLSPERNLSIDFREDPQGGGGRRLRAAIYHLDGPIPLSERVPVLENLGFSVIDERTHRVNPLFSEGPHEVALHDMALESADRDPIDLTVHDARMEACFLAVFRGDAENDNFNRLIVRAGADWREVATLRAYAAYLRQIRSPFGPRYIADTLNRHAGMTRDLIELFHTRFDPGRTFSREERKAAEDRIRKRIEGALAQVPSLDEDRILRHYLNLITATVRTNFFQRDPDGQPPATIAFKFASGIIDALPHPKPFREIWVYSPRVEGVHLRFAPIARGGIRWSDRAQDFRTEVLGLAKAQQVKNAVIVPEGAKGGFLPKKLPRSGDRDEVMREGIAAYQSFISTLLDITDNIVGGQVVPPPRVVRHDNNDPYLVVAADKGTATFSDIANEISAQHRFWLGDAFASGGSQGYDHKRMAITARGAWECVKRHFREMDVDIQTTTFRVVGVGDMSGDVFGNGMLLSHAIRLVAAFDHRDIFIDPHPDPATSFAERRRLFDKPRSSWQDYDRAKISKGGGMFSRSAKSIPLSDEIRQLLNIDATALTPAELMRAILKCETDLLWFGGIGTYIRATNETDEEVGDRANDAIRVTSDEVRAKVIGEGANLGVTQRGRIEYANLGGRLNTDFIDNSAGVNSSDQEVNIKIALGPAVADGRLDADSRQQLLVSMTEDVGAACLVNNDQQSLALSLAQRHSARDLGYLARLTRVLESRGLIERKLEGLPGASEMASREAAGIGLTRPELAVLLSFAKIALSADLIASKVPDDPACEPMLISYFPPALRERFAADIKDHRLRREIIVTGLTNAIINHGGPAVAVRLSDETGRDTSDVASAYLAAVGAFDLTTLWREIDALDGKIKGENQLALYARVQDFLVEQTEGFLRHEVNGGLAETITVHRAGIAWFESALRTTATPRQLEALEEAKRHFESLGAPVLLAARLASLDLLGHGPSITWLAQETGHELEAAAGVSLATADYLRLDELKAKAAAISVHDYYDRLALSGAIHTLEAARRALAIDALAAHKETGADFESWERERAPRLARAKAMLDEVAQATDVTVSRLTVAAAQLRELAGG